MTAKFLRGLAFASALSIAVLARGDAPARKSTVLVPMQDGVRLSTDVYQPEPPSGSSPKAWPVIFMRGPYGKGGADFGRTVCGKGYVLVVQDMRGRFASEGTDDVVFHNDAWGARHDGQESLAWITRQPWCNGSIATYGGSALGITQVLEAPGAPSSLKAQYVQVAFSDMYSQAAYQGGAWRKALLESWLTAAKFNPKSLDAFVKHPNYDRFWEETNTEPQAARVDAPGIYWGGWYDIFVQGTINSFVNVHNFGGPHARGKCRLILGPYAHGPFEGLKYPPNSQQQPVAGDAFRFFDYHLKGIANGVPQDAPVHYYVMGDPTDPKAPGNVWRTADNWPPDSHPSRFYLLADGRLEREPSPAADASRSYRYDPAHPVPTLGGQNLFPPKGPADLRPIESRKDVLVYSSPVLKEPLEVTGHIQAKLFVSTDCPDTDFTVLLADVYPDGRSMLVTDGILRAKSGASLPLGETLKPSETYELTVDLWSTSLIFNSGHRIRVLVSSSNAPRFEPNPNTGHSFRADKEIRVATNTVHMSFNHPSHVILPVIARPRFDRR